MSAGHRHAETTEAIIPDGLYEATAELVEACTIDRDHTVPYLANRSTDGETVYIDEEIPDVLKSGIRPDDTLPWHELSEWLCQNDYMKYPQAHQIATQVEKRRVEELGGDWKEYSDEFDGYIREVDDEDMTNVPSDIDLRPYEDEHDQKALQELAAKGISMPSLSARMLNAAEIRFLNFFRKEATAGDVHTPNASGDGKKKKKPAAAALTGASETLATAQVVKIDEGHGLVLGWAIVCKKDGADYYDLQDDHIPEDSMLAASVDFMQAGAMAKEMHTGGGKGTILFAFPMTTDIAKAFGIETKTTGLLIAMKPDSAEMLGKFRDGTYKGFSIGGVRITDEEEV